ncbi:MAG: ATP-binding protein [Nanoarchaeota archaeon]|nr:ATP-binding protein [Nanoarchaeota archaeon]MBU1632314.1 ATP-binding protein [Nanoarchaeota archaeon]MBU1875804.1 ATP-binding protein [Nanoarchaeota archaeon]
MVNGQVVSGDFSKIIMRVKGSEQVELGELVVINDYQEKFILQVYDLVYGSQISQQNLEMVAGMNLEEGNFSIMDEQLRNYQLAFLKPILNIAEKSKTCKKLPSFFSKVRRITKEDLFFITKPTNPFFLGRLRSGSKELDFDIFLPGKDTLSHHVLIPASTGKGKSNLMSCILWDLIDKDYAGLLVLDPHDEYYGRTGLGLKDHPKKDNVSYYTPVSPPPGARSLKININKLKPEHFQGATSLSDPQRQCLYVYYKKFKSNWIVSLLKEERIENVRFHEDTISVVKRKLISLLNLDFENGQLYCQGIFDTIAGENTIAEICQDLEQSKIVIIDTSYFSGAVEILVGSLITSEVFDKYKYYKKNGQLNYKPVISIVLEEAPRVLGKKVLEQGSNIFDTLAREGRKFKVGLIAITQLPSEIPKNILANMNTKIILGIEMNSERQAVIESSPQDLSQDNRNIASLDKGEALVTSTFTKFAVPVKIPLFKEFVKKDEKKIIEHDYMGFS